MDDSKFRRIKKEYDDYYRNLLRQGNLLARDTGVGFWGPSVTDEVWEIFKRIGLNRFKRFLDLGSGDGKVTLLAALFCDSATGVEFDPLLTGKALEMKEKTGVGNARFINDDFIDHDLSPYDIIFHAPDKPLHRGIEEKIINEMRGKLILYGHHFHPQNLELEESFTVDGTLVSIYSKKST